MAGVESAIREKMMSKIKWTKIRTGLWTRPVDPEIQTRMPSLKRNTTIKKLLVFLLDVAWQKFIDAPHKSKSERFWNEVCCFFQFLLALDRK